MAKILVVDDDDHVRGMVSRLLRNAGHEVMDLSSGGEAVAAVGNTGFDALVVDLVMPEIGGIETIMAIHRVAPDLPTIVMSGKIPLEDEAVNRLVERYGAKSVLAKPFTAAELVAAVAAVV